MNTTHKGTIYIVDDDEGVRASSCFLLETMGFSVESFPDSESFLEVVQSRPADCVILDYHLPGMSGLDLLELMRRREMKMPAIIMTGTGRHIAARAAEAGAIVLLRKPLAADALSLWLDRIFSDK